jgi:hypothetical protein
MHFRTLRSARLRFRPRDRRGALCGSCLALDRRARLGCTLRGSGLALYLRVRLRRAL